MGPFAAPDRGFGVEVERGQVLGIDLDERDVGALVAADDLGDEFTAIGQFDGHFARAVDDMRVGHDVAIRTHDEAGAHALRRFAAAACPGHSGRRRSV